MDNTPAPASATVPALLPLWPTAGRILGLSRLGTYRAASRGELPVWQGEGRKRVVTAKLADMIGRPITPGDIADAA